MLGTEVVERVDRGGEKPRLSPEHAGSQPAHAALRLVGVLLPDLTNSVFSPILGGVTEALGEAGYSVVVADAGTEGEHQARLFNELLARRVDGLVLATASRSDPLVERTLESGVPTVLVNRAESGSRVGSVVSDDGEGMRLAVEHLIDLGHRSIAHIAGPPHLSTGFLRRRGLEKSLSAHGLAPVATTIARAFSREEGRLACLALLDKTCKATAIVAANDLLAMGAYEALRERGLSCPGDISIVGHNDMPLVDMINPPLTTVRIRHRTMGREAARLLLSQIEDADTPVQSIVLMPELIVPGIDASAVNSPARADPRLNACRKPRCAVPETPGAARCGSRRPPVSSAAGRSSPCSTRSTWARLAAAICV
jgi:LacI family transcriptional regulator